MTPVLPKLLHRISTYDAAWVAGPPPNRGFIYTAMDDGMLRCLELAHYMYLRPADAKGTSMIMLGGVCVLCVCVCVRVTCTSVLLMPRGPR